MTLGDKVLLHGLACKGQELQGPAANGDTNNVTNMILQVWMLVLSNCVLLRVSASPGL